MIDSVDPTSFLNLAQHYPIFDVRAPQEFVHGHIPGAHNLPLFTDEQRALVGTMYAQQGKEVAIAQGLTIVGPQLHDYVNKAKQITSSKHILIHCWRGGLRSKSLAWLFNLMGYDVTLLDGGYKAYRKLMLALFEQQHPLVVLGGKTGSGKTHILQELKNEDEQVIDLEALAHHRGSAFGGLGKTLQPTQAQFENQLGIELFNANRSKPIWIEDESVRIGSLFVPNTFLRS